MTECDEIVIFMDTIATQKTNTITTKMINTTATNVTSTASINGHVEKVGDCYILHTVLLVIILLLIIAITCYLQKGIL